MKDIQKDPIQAQQAAMPQHDNTALKIVVIVLIVVFGLPLILIIAAFVFISANFDKFTEWVDDHIDEWGDGSSLSSGVAKSASHFYDAVQGKNVKVSKDDCWNIKTLFGNNNSSAWLMSDVCNDEEIQVGSKEKDGNKSIFFNSDNACLEVIFNSDFTKNYSYNYNSFNNVCNAEMKTIKLEDIDDDDDLDEDDDKDYIKPLEG